ncbi:MAG TPA: hypothetical protein VFT02_09355 [Pyrinomonadaceae bacterium]|nr:hypothetical protein [Pyrinomonadaceae bacterium]
MFSQSLKAAFAALRALFGSWTTLVLVGLLYGGLLVVGYLFVSTREATIMQLAITLSAIVAAPALFFALQAVSVNYANNAGVTHLIEKTARDSLRLIVVSVPLILLTALAVYGLSKINSQETLVTAARYLLIGVIAPLLAIQLWVAASSEGLRSLLRRIRPIAAKAFAPQSVFVYASGLLFFAVAPSFLIFVHLEIERTWLEVSLLVVRLLIGALLIVIGWVTTVGTLSILAKR